MEPSLYPGEPNDADSDEGEDEDDNNDDEYSDGGLPPSRSKAGRRGGSNSGRGKRTAPTKRAARPKYASADSQGSDSAPQGAFTQAQDQPGVPRIARRENHNSAEKRRRDKINDKLAILRSLLPYDGMSNASKAQTLARTVDYLRQLEATHADATKMHKQLLQRKQQLLGGAPVSDALVELPISRQRASGGTATAHSSSTTPKEKPKRQSRAKRVKKENDDEYVPTEPLPAVVPAKLILSPAARGVHNPTMVTIDASIPGQIQQPKSIPATSMQHHIFTAHGHYGLPQTQPIFLHNLGQLQQGAMHQEQDPRAMQHHGGPYFIPQEFNYFRPHVEVKAEPTNQYGAPEGQHYFNPLPVRGAMISPGALVAPTMPQISTSLTAAGAASETASKPTSPPAASASASVDPHSNGSLMAALPASSSLQQKTSDQTQSQLRQPSRLPDINEPPGAADDAGATSTTGLRIPRPERSSPTPSPIAGAHVITPPPPPPGPEMPGHGVGGPSAAGMNHLHPYPQDFYHAMFSSPLRGPSAGGPPLPGAFGSADDSLNKAMNFLQVPYGSGDLITFGAPGSPRSVYFTPGARSPLHLSMFSTPPMPISPNSPNGGHSEAHGATTAVPTPSSAESNADTSAKPTVAQPLPSIDSSVNYSTSGPPKPAAGSAFNRTGSAHLTPPGAARPTTLLHPAMYASPTHQIVGLSPPASPMHPGAVQSLYSLYGSLNFPTPPVALEHPDHAGHAPFVPQFFQHLLTPPTHANQMMEMMPGLPRVVVDEVKTQNN
eukprot:TRINITY_DN11425_c0_g1_i1.p1 TRINITY_DN11425_c0_g1~~TRINITY_DN11425_c0_g1_i1.p1  ORF type:complete len:879 (-),score=116.13 TRINITY_DN11425_c0_g1_i1:43-2370(-)